jgi:NAD(P)H-flavin reductase
MSLRRRIARWLGGIEDPRDEGVSLMDDPQSWAGGLRSRPAPATDDRLTRDDARPAPGEVPVGGLVVGSAQLRTAEIELPGFYRPAPVAVKEPMPFAEPGLLTKYTDYDPSDLRDAWEIVRDRFDTLVTMFYAELFIRLPEAMTMFPSHMTQQRQDFGKALVQWVLADEPDEMAMHLHQLGADHRKFDVEPRHYEVAGAALVSAWKTLSGPRWTPRHEAAVIGSYTRLASAMLDGAMRSLQQPASWSAHVVDHQRILRDFAVVRIQPEAPYAYKAGQYLTLELESQPRQWRQMSIASAPRADNTFDVHVRAVGSSGVSGALVMHTRVGDRLRLGPPRGNDLVIEPGTVPAGLLCVASGTGAAPITAVVESVLSWPDQTPLYAFLGGRTREDIYAVDRLNDLIRARGRWQGAQVHGVVSDDPEYVGYRGRVETLVPSLANWGEIGMDVLVAGPDPMIAATVKNLTDVGVPLDKIHFDQYELAG